MEDLDNKTSQSLEEEDDRAVELEGLEDENEKTGEPGGSEDDIPLEPEDNRVRSQLGRRVSELDMKLSRIEEMLSQVMYKSEPKNEESVNDILDEFDDDMPLTKRDVVQLLRAERQREERANEKYNNDYLNTINSFASDPDIDPEIYREVIAEMSKPGSRFNVRHSDNGAIDAQMNFLKAQTYVLKNKFSGGKRNPLKGNRGRTGLDISSGTNDSNVRTPKITRKLPADAKDFAKHFGYTDEDLARVLGEE